jgi:hypothetical protein
MRFTYFNECKNLEDVKKAFRVLAKQHHPDLGGNAETFKTINNEYEEAFEYFKNEFNNRSENAKKQNTETPEEFKDIINILIKLDGLDIEICDTWLWLSGNTYIHRETLKELKFKWSKSKKKWYCICQPKIRSKDHLILGHFFDNKCASENCTKAQSF